MKDVGSAKLKLVKSHSGKTDVFDGIQGFYNEDYFNRMLSLERKRTQRSKKPFMLMLIDISKLVNPHPNLVVINSIGRVLDAGIRETDVRGWYRKGHSIGVIFTELESACAAVRDKIFGKLLLSLAGEIDPKDLAKIDVSFHIFPEDQDKGNCSGRFNMNLYKDLLEGEKKNGISRKMKRFMDIVGSLLALVIFSPIILAVAAAVKFTSEGPVLFRQERIGQWGETFTFLKFRSMQVKQAENPHKAYIEKLIKENQSANGNSGEAPVFKLTDDPRVTPVGHFIRKTSLDELPQLINVLRGEMSLVRPSAARALRVRDLRRVAPDAHAVGQAGHHGPLAGLRPQQHQLRRDGPPGPQIRHRLVPLAGHQDHPPDPLGRNRRQGSLLTTHYPSLPLP